MRLTSSAVPNVIDSAAETTPNCCAACDIVTTYCDRSDTRLRLIEKSDEAYKVECFVDPTDATAKSGTPGETIVTACPW